MIHSPSFRKTRSRLSSRSVSEGSGGCPAFVDVAELRAAQQANTKITAKCKRNLRWDETTGPNAPFELDSDSPP
jgi:hypothetical protein